MFFIKISCNCFCINFLHSLFWNIIMSIVTMVYEAKCKHCINFKSGNLVKNDGTLSKKRYNFCGIKARSHSLTLKDKACDKIALE